jgi:hypothetical protein
MVQSIATKIARAAFWPYKGQDKQLIVKLKRITPKNGVTGDYMFNSELVKAPIASKVTHYYLLPTTNFDRWSTIEVNNQRKKHLGIWMSLKDNWNSFNILFDIYTYTGISVPISMVYYRVSNNGVMHLALVEDFTTIKIDPVVDDLYLKMYDNIYYRSGYGNIGNLNFYGKKVSTLADAADIVNIQNTLDLDKCLCFRSGKLIDRHDVAKTAIGDHLEIYEDESIYYKSISKISDMPYYHSTTHNCNKFVFVINNNGVVNTQERCWVDDTSFYLYNEVEKVGIYLHTNIMKNIMNLTHNVFSIASDYLNDVSEKNGELFNLSNCSIIAICRKDNSDEKVFSTTLCLNDLYYTAFSNNGLDPKSIAQLICSPSTIAQWRGNNLETGVLNQFFNSNYGNSDIISKDLVGYHSLFDVYGNSLQPVSNGYKVPDIFSEDFVIQTFDSNGLATDLGNLKKSKVRPFSIAAGSNGSVVFDSNYFNVMPQYVKYYPSMQQAELINVTMQDILPGMQLVSYPRLNNDTGIYDSHRTSSIVTLNKYREYKFYYKGTLEKYYRPAELGTHYTINGNVLTWLTNSNTINTCIRSSEDGYCFHGVVNLLNSGNYKKRTTRVVIKYSPEVLNGHISVGSVSVPNNYVRRHEDVLWGYIHVYVNGRRLIENIDYVISRENGEIIIHSSVALLNNTTDQTFKYSVYCFGHPNAEGGRNKALEFGVVYKSMISNNSKYESYKNRNCSMVVNGSTVNIDQGVYKLANENQTSQALHSFNSSFYLIEDNYYDVAHMYQSYSDFNTSEQMKKELDFRVVAATAINAVKVSQDPTGSDTSINRTVLVSAFLNAIILDVLYDNYAVPDYSSSLDVNHHRTQLVNLYNDLYVVDPVYRWNNDLKLFTQHIDLFPTYCNYELSMNMSKFRFIKEIVNAFAPQIDINRFINITN